MPQSNAESNEMSIVEWVKTAPNSLKPFLLEILKRKVVEYTAAVEVLSPIVRAMEAHASSVLADAAPSAKLTVCACCVAGGDEAQKLCEYRTDTGIKEGWYCEECYQEWKNTP